MLCTKERHKGQGEHGTTVQEQYYEHVQCHCDIFVRTCNGFLILKKLDISVI